MYKSIISIPKFPSLSESMRKEYLESSSSGVVVTDSGPYSSAVGTSTVKDVEGGSYATSMVSPTTTSPTV